MISKKFLQKSSSYIVMIVILGLALASVLRLAFWNNLIWSESGTSQDATYSIKGRITEKRTSCGGEILDSDSKPKRVAGICDAGNSIVINEMRISTGGGALVSNPPKYITNIESVHAGDIVEVRYIQDQEGHPSTNCESCYIQKEGSPQKEPQSKQDR